MECESVEDMVEKMMRIYHGIGFSYVIWR